MNKLLGTQNRDPSAAFYTDISAQPKSGPSTVDRASATGNVVAEISSKLAANFRAFSGGEMSLDELVAVQEPIWAEARAAKAIDRVAGEIAPSMRQAAEVVAGWLCDNWATLRAGGMTQAEFEKKDRPLWVAARAAGLERACMDIVQGPRP